MATLERNLGKAPQAPFDPQDGRKPAAAKNARFWDRVADKYAASPIKDPAAYERTLERTRSYLSHDQQVLEVGCGTGSTALRLAADVRHLTATDISERMIAIAAAKAARQGARNVRFRQAGLPDDGLAPGSFDAVLSFNALHLMEDLPAVLGSLNAALKPGGVFISKTVCLAEQTRLWAIPIAVLRLIGKAPFVAMLSFAEIERAIAAAGFEIVETGTYPAPFSRFVAARKV